MLTRRETVVKDLGSLLRPRHRPGLWSGRRNRGLFDGVANRLGVEAVPDAEVGVDVTPAGRAFLQLLPQLADEDVDRAFAVCHRVPPHPLVDGLPLQHLPLGPGSQWQEL